jgi:hypothetical protein
VQLYASDLNSRRSAALRAIRCKNYRAIGELLVALTPKRFEQMLPVHCINIFK